MTDFVTLAAYRARRRARVRKIAGQTIEYFLIGAIGILLGVLIVTPQ